jgi:hypothetical protein
LHFLLADSTCGVPADAGVVLFASGPVIQRLKSLAQLTLTAPEAAVNGPIIVGQESVHFGVLPGDFDERKLQAEFVMNAEIAKLKQRGVFRGAAQTTAIVSLFETNPYRRHKTS